MEVHKKDVRFRLLVIFLLRQGCTWLHERSIEHGKESPLSFFYARVKIFIASRRMAMSAKANPIIAGIAKGFVPDYNIRVKFNVGISHKPIMEITYESDCSFG